MLNLLKKENMGSSNLGWLESRFHFSFAEYRNPNNINFGVLRVLNDDIIHPQSGFDTHPHQDMEIISYIVQGEITHKDSMNNEENLKRGEVQYLSAGTGILHSEHNRTDKDLRLLQIWIIPPYKGMNTLYGSHRYKEQERKNKLLNIVSSQNGDAMIKIYQDINIYVSELDAKKSLEYKIQEKRQVYFVLIEGRLVLNTVELNYGDAIEITNENSITMQALEDSHFLFIEMAE
jgi:quercetin 2,3-dioxygenase